MFPKKNIFAKKTPRRLWRARRIWALIPVFCAAAAVQAGVFSDSLFRFSWDAAHCTIADSLIVAVRYPNLMRLEYGPVKPNTTATTPKTPDVISFVNNGFRFFWSDSGILNGNGPKVFRRDALIIDTGVTISDPVNASGNQGMGVPLGYLHAKASDTSYLVTIVEKNSTLKGYSNRSKNVLDSIGKPEMTANASLCRWRLDTFLSVYTKSNSLVKVKKVYLSGTAIKDSFPEITFAQNQNYCINPTIAADSSGHILSLWMQGPRDSVKKLTFAYFDSSFTFHDSATLAGTIDDKGVLNYYDEAPVVSYARGKFVAACWDVTGIMLRRFEIKPALPLDTVAADVLRVPSRPGARYPAITSNGRYIAVVWREGAAPQGSINGLRYPIVNGVIDAASPDSILNVAAPLDAVDTVSVNCTMDSSGNVGVCWQTNHIASICALATRNILFDTGSWTTLPVRVQTGLKDSLCIDSAAVSLGARPTGTGYSAFLGMGPDSVALNASTAFGSSATLATSTRGLFNFIQCKVLLNSSPNLLKTPAIKKLFVRWNSKPRIDTLAAFQVNALPVRVKFKDTVLCLSRFDTLSCRLRIVDADGDFVYSSVTCRTQTVVDSFFGLTSISSPVRLLPLLKSDSVYTCRFSGRDKRGWAAQDSVLYIKTRNSIPVLRVRAVRNRSPVDTTDVTAQGSLNVQQSDSVEFLYSLRDTNDNALLAYVSRNGLVVDSTIQGVERHFVFRCSSGRPQGDQFLFSAADPDTTVTRRMLCGVNHFPRIDSIRVNGNRVHGGDTVRVVLAATTSLAVYASDTDVGYWDTLTYAYRYGAVDSILRASTLSYTASRFDTALTVTVSDLFGVRDSLRFFIKFPWFETDSTANAALFASCKLLRSGVSLIIGGGLVDTVAIPIHNSGNDTLMISALRFSGSPTHWLRLLIPQGQAMVRFDSIRTHQASAFPCPPDSTVSIRALFSADDLSGDGIVRDSIILATNDPMHSRDTLPVQLEFNDLPRIDSTSIDFTRDKPYWLAKTKKHSTQRTYVFPPHAKLSIRFSEPMDSLSALGGLTVYSVFDSTVSGVVAPIPLVQSWSRGRTCVSLSPRYDRPSPYFRVQPPSGLFIPTDSLRLRVASSLTDTAKTPGGPNNLDIHKLNRRSAAADTVFSYRVDSITYAVTSVFPDSASTGVSLSTPIRITFSSPPLVGTVDTSKTGNRSLMVRSAYSKGQPCSFRRVSQSGDTVAFFPSKRFFYGDTVYCRYRAVTGRDSLGYPVAVSPNGLPIALFDTASSQGDKIWFFVIKDVVHASVYPAPGAVNVSPDSAIRVFFDDSIQPGAIDTSRTGNRTIIVTSRCSGGKPLAFSSAAAADKNAFFRTARRLYYGDSVRCDYRGLSTLDTALYAVEKTTGAALFTKDSLSWFFTVKNIDRVSVSPESSTVSSSIHPEIVITFSDPIYPGTFDTDTSIKNRSFAMTSTFTKDSLLPFAAVGFAAGNTQVRLKPKASFFSKDSVQCTFLGFLKNINYDVADNLPAASTAATGAYAWPFFIQNAGFYTFPNPYKPGLDPRHCAANGPCGIWFKNLHTLKRGVTEVAITIYAMSAHPLYSTKSAGVSIRFAAGNADLRPEWKWDTRNQQGALVASGLYLYAIFDMKDNVLIKGKLMIVR